MVIWFLGLSGVGKTTLGMALKNYFDEQNIKNFLIDGDSVRHFFDNDLGYTQEERRENIKRIMLAAHVLEQSGSIPIVCNISPFEDLRHFARSKFQNYVQIYLKRDRSAIANKDFVYNSTEPVVGKDIVFEVPMKSELTLNTEAYSLEQSIAATVGYIQQRLSQEKR